MKKRDLDVAKLKIDCENCDVLCCGAFHLPYPDYPKLPRIACKHLDDAKCRCSIYSELEQRKYDICLKFDCRGAGVAVSHVFRGMGKTWITSPDIADAEFHTFLAVYYIVLQHLNPQMLEQFDMTMQLRDDLQPFIDAAMDYLSIEDKDEA